MKKVIISYLTILLVIITIIENNVIDWDYFAFDDIMDASGLNLDSLEGIEKYNNSISSLDLNGNKIKDITNLKHFIKLEGLYLAKNQIEDLSPIESLNNLVNLDVSYNKIINMYFY